MASGRQTLAEIERSIADLRTQEEKERAALDGLNNERVGIINQRTAAFRELAEVRARSAVADGIIDRADQLRHRVASLLEARQRTIEGLEIRSSEAHRERERRVAHADAVKAEIGGIEKRIDDIALRARAELTKDPVYTRLVARRDELIAMHEKAESKTKRAEDDRKTKGAAYEADPLFMYLWRRRHRQTDDRPWVLIAWLDDWVADLVRYHEARANYAMLNEIPERLRAHTDRLEADAATHGEEVDEIEAAKIKDIAGRDLSEDLTAAHAREIAALAAIETIDAEITEIAAQLTRYSEGLDDSFREAVALSAGFLERSDRRKLMREARETVEPSDDKIVARIETLDDKASGLDERIKDSRKTLDRIAKQRQELLEIAAKFRRNRLDSWDIEFDADDIAEDLLKLFLRGAITAAEYWVRSQTGYRRRSRPGDVFRRSEGFPPWGAGGWSSGGNRSRRSGRRRSGGGFRTGGGF